VAYLNCPYEDQHVLVRNAADQALEERVVGLLKVLYSPESRMRPEEARDRFSRGLENAIAAHAAAYLLFEATAHLRL
jgi:hypothetical protein